MYYKDDEDIISCISIHDYKGFIDICKNRVSQVADVNQQTDSKRQQFLKLNTITLRFIPPLALLLSLIIKEQDKQEQAKITYSYIIDFLKQVNPNLLNYISNNIRNNLFSNKVILDILKEMLSIDEYNDLIHIIIDIILSVFTSKRWLTDKYIGLQAISAIINRSLSLLILRKVKHEVRSTDKIYSTSDTRSYFIATLFKQLIRERLMETEVNDNDKIYIKSDNFVYKYFIVPLLSLKYDNAKSLMLLDDKTRTEITYHLLSQIKRPGIGQSLLKIASKNLSVSFVKNAPVYPDINTIYVTVRTISNGFIQYEVTYIDKKTVYGVQKLKRFLNRHNPSLNEYIVQSSFIEQWILLMYAIFDTALRRNTPDNADSILDYILRVYQNIIKNTILKN